MLLFRFLWLAAAPALFAAEPALYELSGHMVPRLGAYVSLFGVNSPYSTSTLADASGHFKFKKLEAGTYTLAIFSRRRGEARRTIEVGPATADRKGRIALTFRLAESDFEFSSLIRQNLISTRQLAVPESALHDYREAQKDLSRHDADSARKRLEHAVDLAPQFAAAWNTLGVIAYQTRKYDRAEECFREAAGLDPQSFEALVNLGGVLVTLRKLDEALDYNLKAVLARPNDALANAQLGMTYFSLGQEELALKYLERARDLDPAHFSHPQLLLFQIHVHRGQREIAAGDLEDFLKQHPDWPQATQFRETIMELRAPSR
jgi:tetratricopeptide (TPR) repeat protein